MRRSSHQQYDFDSRLLAVEELFRQRKYDVAARELAAMSDAEFEEQPHEFGLYLALSADSRFNEGSYKEGLQLGTKAANLLADLPLNKRYGRALLVLSKIYSALGDIKNAEIKAYDSLASYRRCGDVLGQVDALNELARIALIRSDFSAAVAVSESAIEKASGDERKVAQLTGNVGMFRVLLGKWTSAEEDLKAAITYHRKAGFEVSLARNLLSLGYLHLSRREFVFAERAFTEAEELIDKLNLKRDRIILLEFQGELALEKGDMFKAKSLLQTAYHDGRMLAPESSLVSQAGRRLAEVEYALDNHDDAMKYAQKSLELALQLGEKGEVGQAHRVIALVFAGRGDQSDAIEHIERSLETAREVADPLALARILLTAAEVRMTLGSDEFELIRSSIDEASRIFKKLGVDYWIAETDFRAGMLACQRGNLSRGFKKLSRSEKTFAAIGDTGKVRRVHQFLASLSDQAIALSVSQENEFKVFGSLVNQSDLEELWTGQMDEVLGMLLRRTEADRAIIYTPDFQDSPVTSSIELTPHQARKFADNFQMLLGQELAADRPSLLLDCRRDPYINDLLPDFPDVVASVVVVPFKMGESSSCYIYLDKLSTDNMLNPFTQDALNFAVGFSDVIAFKSSEAQKARLMEDNRRLKAQLKQEAAFPNIITRNSQFLDILAQVRQVVDSNISVAIEGETGCGKDLLARAIHYNSSRRDKRFISVNCAALPETLLESELFGYRKGSFTGADRDKPGLFEEADGGTFFLDEIADMPLSVQAKILRVLEEKEVVRLGESVPRKVDVRILSATNKDLKEQMAAGQFRSDLYYRLSVLTFRLPSLRERKDDVPLLVNHFLAESNKTMSAETMRALVAYDWPGNVRELENEVKKLILLAGDSPEIGPEVLSSKLTTKESDTSTEGSGLDVIIPDELAFDGEYSLYDYLAEHEKRFIVRALRERKGVKKHAAAMLNIPESTLRLKIKQYGIDLNNLDAVH